MRVSTSGHDAQVISADLRGGDRVVGAGSARVLVRVDPNTTWLFTESHWAGAFPEPTYRELMFWCFRAVPSPGGRCGPASTVIEPGPPAVREEPLVTARLVA